MAGGVARRRDRLDARQEFLTIPEEDDAVAHRQKIGARVFDEGLERRAELAFIRPEIEIDLADIDLRIGEIGLAVRRADAADMVDMGMAADDGVDIPGLMPASCRLFCRRPVVGPKAFEKPMPVSNITSRSPKFTTGTFCSRTTLSFGRKFVSSIL